MKTITKRVDINVGYTCNTNCRFCYYQKSMHAKSRHKRRDMTTEQVKHYLRYIRSCGKDAVDLTGGEPTIRKDFIELVQYAKSLEYKTISVITNGLVMSNKEYTDRLIDAGANDILFSIHGHNAAIHDSLTNVPGSFDKITKAVGHVRARGIKYRTNSVINGLNYKNLDDLARLFCDLGVKTMNLILFNPIKEAHLSDEDMYVPFSEAAPGLMKLIDDYKDRIPKITVRYLPFCYMPGYEKYMTHMAQIQYDPDEWDYVIRHNIRDGRFLTYGAALAGLCMLPPKRIASTDFYTLLRDGIKRFFAFRGSVKGPVCKQCKYDHICYGLWREYAKRDRLCELKAMPGEKVIEPYYVMEEHNEK